MGNLIWESARWRLLTFIANQTVRVAGGAVGQGGVDGLDRSPAAGCVPAPRTLLKLCPKLSSAGFVGRTEATDQG